MFWSLLINVIELVGEFGRDVISGVSNKGIDRSGDSLRAGGKLLQQHHLAKVKKNKTNIYSFYFIYYTDDNIATFFRN